MNLDWIDELFDGKPSEPSAASERLVDYCLALLDSSPLRHIDRYEEMILEGYATRSREEWDEIISMLKQNQHRPVDLYAPSQTQLAKWIRHICFYESDS